MRAMSHHRIGRRTWLTRMAGGLVAVWAGLKAEHGRDGWAGWLGWDPRAAAAGGSQTQTIPVEIQLDFQGTSVPVAAYVVVRGREIAVVDTLVEGNGDRIGAMIQQVGLDWRAVRHVILTHWHMDHAGSAAEVAGLAPQATIWAGEADISQIPLSHPIAAAQEGDEVFGLRIVATPGHTAGHISVLDPTTSTLLTGDSVFNVGELALSPPAFTADMAAALASVQKLGGLTFERALFGHGTPIESGASAAFARLAAAGAELGPHALADYRHNCLLHA